jgi:hypothetical protein
MSRTTKNPRFELPPGGSERFGVDFTTELSDQPSVTVSSATATITINNTVDTGITAASNVSSGQETSFLFSGVALAELGTTWTVDIAATLSNGQVLVRTIYIIGIRVST